MMGRRSNTGGTARPLVVMLAGVLACVLCVGVVPAPNAMAGTVDDAQAAYDAALDAKRETDARVTSLKAAGEKAVAQEALGSVGYFKDRQGVSGGAYRVLTDPTVTRSKYLEQIHAGAEWDATSLANVERALGYLEQFEAIRASEGLSAVPVSDVAMAVGEVNADWNDHQFVTSVSINHTGEYNMGEMLAATYDTPGSRPYDQWYYQEKKNVQSIKDGTWTGDDSFNNVGHYFTVIGGPYTDTGLGITGTGSGDSRYGIAAQEISGMKDEWGSNLMQERSLNDPSSCANNSGVPGCKEYPPLTGRTMSVADWKKDFEAYRDGLEKDAVPYRQALDAQKRAADALDAARKALDAARRTAADPSSKPSTQPSKPSTEPSKPSTHPSKPTTEPSKPSTEPSKPNTQPSTPGTPGTQPSKPSTQPSTQPSSEPSKPSKPSTQPSKPSTPTTQPSKPSASSTVTMWRLYNPNSGEHFYTGNAKERDMLVRIGWKSEGEGWTAPTSGDPVYRLYNPNAGDHHYTLNPGERDMLVKVGWTYEGVGWHSATASDTDRKPLYRQYNPNAVAGAHNYTLSKAENDHLARIGWCAEGLAWYAV